MFYQLFPRMSLETNEQLTSQAVSGEDESVIVAGLTIYTLAGTSPQVLLDIESSDDGERWVNVGTIVTATTPGLTYGHFAITGNPWGRLLRARVTISGTSTVAEFAVGLHAHQSS